MLSNKRIVIGITGGIAAYKVPDLVSRLVKAGADVHVIMTDSAAQFITPLTLKTISRNPVIVQMFDGHEGFEVKHISLADKADLFLVMPATANIIGKLACGIADDMLSTTVMATRAPVLVVPAMNVHMYENCIVQSNIEKLRSLGYNFLEPESGHLACGYEGKGRLPGLDVIFEAVCNLLLTPKDMEGKTVLVTAGPTREFIDPVRFISNRSSGKMGFAIAEAARARGARVILISGPVSIRIPDGVKYIPIVSAEEMFQQVVKHYLEADIVIKAAAVADYRPKVLSPSKVKKKPGDTTLELERTPDILKHLGENKKANQILVGFAAETDNLENNAFEKIRTKNLDFIVANDITQPGAGFDVDTNIVKFMFKDGRTEVMDKMSKRELAHRILDRVASIINDRR